jgi:arylsulfatase A-like enzyme
MKWAAAVLVALAVGGGVWWWTYNPKAEIGGGQCKGCNFILVSIDSLRADHMSLYGYKRKTTPVIDEWAKNSLVLDHYFASAYLTPISEGSVHTGLYPEVNGMTSFRRTFSPKVTTMAEMFKANGYRTAAVGSSPEFHNFEAIRDGFKRGFDEYHILPARLANDRTPPWLEAKMFLRASKKPFFMWIPLGDVHAPFGEHAENKYIDPNYKGPFSEMKFFTNMQFYHDGWIYDPFAPDKAFQIIAWRGGKSMEMHRMQKDLVKKRKWPVKATPQDMQFMIDSYDNGINEADREFEFILKMVRDNGLADNTVILLQAEHGESLGERGYIAHYDVKDESIRVPFVFSSPAGPQAVRSDIMVSGVDVLPTVVEHLGLNFKPDYPLDGLPVLEKGRLGKGREEVYLTRTPLWESIIRAEGQNRIFDRFRALDDQIGFKDHAVRSRTGKVIHRTARLIEEQFSCWTFVSGKKIPREEFEYYDVANDPGEKKVLPVTGEAVALKEKLLNWKEGIKVRAQVMPATPLVQDYQ